MASMPRRIAAPALTFTLAIGLVLGALQPVSAGAAASAEAAEDTGTITGTMLGVDGALMPGEVRIYQGDALWVAKSANVDPATGAFAITGIVPGTYRVLFMNTGTSSHVNEWWNDAYARVASTAVTIEAGASVALDSRLEVGATISGILTTTEGPVAVPQGTVRLSGGLAGLNSVSRTADATGAYRYDKLAPGDYTMTFSGDIRWLTVDHNGIRPGQPAGDPIALSPGEQVTVDVTLQRSPAIEGTVLVSQAGGGTAPWVGGVTLRDADDPHAHGRTMQTDSQGRYAFVGIAPGDYTIEFKGNTGYALREYWNDAADWSEAATITVADGQPATGIDAVLDLGGRYRANVTYPDGVGGALGPDDTVWIDAFKRDDETGVYRFWSTAWAQGGGIAESATLPVGSYAIYAYVGDRYDIGSEYWKDARYFADRTDVVIEAGKTIDLGELRLEPRVFDVGRIASSDRYATAVEASKAALPDGGAPVVYIASGVNYPDALAAGPAAGVQGGVVLLVHPEFVPTVVADEIRRLDPDRIVVAGGPVAVSDAAVAQLRGLVADPGTVDRIGGATRYETAEMIVRDAFEESGSYTAFIATGRNYPDALAAGPAAAHLGAPVVMVDGGAASVSPETLQLLRDLGVRELRFVGGPVAVSDGIRYSILNAMELPGGFYHFDGADRFAVARQINDSAFRHADMAFIATGYGYADALSGGPLAAAFGAPMYLSRPECIPNETAVGLLTVRTQGVGLIGGEAVLAPAVERLEVCGG